MDQQEEKPEGIMEKPEGTKEKLKKGKLFWPAFWLALSGGVLVPGISLGLYPVLGGAVCWVLGFALYTAFALGTAKLLRRRLSSEVTDSGGGEHTGGQFHAMSVSAGQHILMQLLQRETGEGQGMEQLLKRWGIEFPWPCFCVAVLKIDDYGMVSEDYSDQDVGLFKFSMCNIVTELLSTRMKVYHTGNGMDYVTLIMNMENRPGEGELTEVFAEAIRLQADYFGIGFSAGIGTAEEGLYSVSESYNNALDAAAYRLFYGKQSVIEYGSIALQESVHMDYPYDMEQEMLRQAIRFHNRVKTMEYLDEFVERVRHISAEDANLYIQQLGVAVNRALRQTEGLSAGHLYSMREFSHFMETLTTLKEKQHQIRTSLDELFQMAAEGADRKKQGIVQKVEEFVVQNYRNPDITLEDMAMAAGLSSNYIRRIFRDQCGYSPMDYLVNYRIETAKELLKNTSHTAKEIAEMVGYVNTKYFYSLFKKQTGQTTYEYKRSTEK